MDNRKFKNEWGINIIPKWRPYDACRLRLKDLVLPKHPDYMTNDDGENNFNTDICPPFQLYWLVREVQPSLIVETGVQNGFTTELVLGALKANEKGKLVSIDIGLDTWLNQTWGANPGCLVRHELRSRWELIRGDSQTELKKLCAGLGTQKIDIFHHDDEHSTENIEAEIDIVLPHMNPKGVICMHDRDQRIFRQETEGKIVRLPRVIEEDTEFTIWKIVV